MLVESIRELIFEGDTVLDHMDDSEREIQHFVIHDIDSASVFMTDGGVIGLNEIKFNDFENLDSQSMATFVTS